MNTAPTPATPIEADAAVVGDRLATHRVPVTAALRAALVDSGAAVFDDEASRAEAGRDWWPVSIAWAVRGNVASRPAVVVRPSSTAQVAAVLTACHAAGVPVTAMAGRSGVCGGSVPVFGGVALDLTGLAGVVQLDEESLLVDVRAGTFGPDLEAALAERGYSLGHFPQSMAISTVGGWLACRGAGQYSTRYGKIEDMVVGLEVVLADGRAVRTEGNGPRAATGPNLTQLFVGCEGTLGIITEARLRIHPTPAAEARRAFGFPTFAAGLDAARRVLRRGATPAVLRLYDAIESARHFATADTCVLVVLDEGDPLLLEATMAVVDEECRSVVLDPGLVERWLAERNDVSALAPLWRADVVVDTAEVAGRWRVLSPLADDVLAALRALEGTLVASVHESHAYPDGACLYFTFAGRQPDGDPAPGSGDPAEALAWEEGYYRRAWAAVVSATTQHGAAISHHHGIGLNRGPFLRQALGESFEVLEALKAGLDPTDTLNPGKLGLASRHGDVGWP